MEIYCCACEKKVEARLTKGVEVYPYRRDLYHLPFWKCDTCENTVGCHHQTKNPTQPLGCIPTKEIKEARKKIHKILDPLWKSGQFGRKEIYKILEERIGDGRKYHTANIRTLDEARKVYAIILNIKKEKK